MAGRISGPLLKGNLLRNGIDLAFETDLLYLDVINSRIGIRTNSPMYDLDVNGAINAVSINTPILTVGDLAIQNNVITSTLGDINISANNSTDKINFNNSVRVQGDLHASGNITADGDITIGNEITDTVTFKSEITSDLLPADDSTIYNLGSPDRRWGTLYVNNIDIANDIIQNALDGSTIALGYPDDSTWTDGAYLGFVPDQSISEAIDNLNEVLNNVRNNTFVRDVNFTPSATLIEIGESIDITIVAEGNPTEYDVDWGDGTVVQGITSTTASHAYNSRDGTPYTVTVTARNTNGSGTGSEVQRVKEGLVFVYPPNPVVDADFYRTAVAGAALKDEDFYVIEGSELFLDNNTTNTADATVEYIIDWGDGTPVEIISSDNDPGGALTATRLGHTWGQGTSSGTDLQDVILTLTEHSEANPLRIPSSRIFSLKVYDDTPAAPDGLSAKTIALATTNGLQSRLCENFLSNDSGISYTSGDIVLRVDDTVPVTESSIIDTFAYNGDSGTLRAELNGASVGQVTLDSGDNAGVYASLSVTEESDYNLLDAQGNSISWEQSIYYPTAFKGFKAKFTKNTNTIPVGVNTMQLAHSETGSTNIIEFVKDSITSTPSITLGNLAQISAGTLRYISGVPYYNTGNPVLILSNASISNLTGQTYLDSDNIVRISSAENLEGTVQNCIDTQNYSYSDIEGTTPIISNGIPVTDIGLGSPYAIGDLTILLGRPNTRTVERIQIRASNSKGNGPAVTIPNVIQVHTAEQSGISEISIPVSPTLGDGSFTDNGVRIFDFASNATDTPSYNGQTDFYTNNPYTENADLGVQGTQEATIRLGVLKHLTTNYSQYLPSGPNRSGDTGRQYFTFAFRRQVVFNFSVDLVSSTGIAGLWVAVPGTITDSTSTLNGWLTTNEVYVGAGIPGANTNAGGNGSNGISITSGDLIPLNTAIDDNYSFTLGSNNLTAATGNAAIIRIALDPGQEITYVGVR